MSCACTFQERDLLLARAMQRSDAKCLVGVVGLGHLPGICRVWTEACTPTNHLKAAEYFLPIPADVVPFSNAEKWGQYAAASIGVTGIAGKSWQLRHVIGFHAAYKTRW